ncbi:MAG TPA: hypothetical protein VN752_09430 [Solirubrobacterales bacterium]|nr:hypothetical protein [Solirubrobacterales bacterium]
MNCDDHVRIVEGDYHSYAFATDFSKIPWPAFPISINTDGIRYYPFDPESR